MPARRTLAQWVVSRPEFADALTRAREHKADWLADEVVHVADTEPDAQRARVKTDARKWAAGVLNPKRYGQKMDINITERPRIGQVLEQARQRLPGPVRDQLEHRDQQVIETTVEVTTTPTDNESADPDDADPFS